MGISLNSIQDHPIARNEAITQPPTRLQGVSVTSPVAPLSPVAAKRDSVSVNSSGSERFGLSEIGAALETPARISNSLATADQALSTLGELLGSVHSTLNATQPGTAVIDQASIHSTFARIDQLTGTTTFGGQKLLDGTYSVSLNGATLSIPSFITATSEKPSVATVGTSIHQVSSTRKQIADFQTQAIQPFTEAGQSALAHLIASPTIDHADSAASNAVLTRAQSLLQPAATLNAFRPSAEHVLDLLRIIHTSSHV